MNQRRRIGLLTPSSDIAMEYDLWTHLPPDTSLHVARMYLEATTVAGEEKMLDEELAPAARSIATVEPEMVIFGCTSAAALRGLEGDRIISETVTRISGAPCITVIQAVLTDIRAVNPSSLFVFTPYVADVTARLKDTLEHAGLKISGLDGLGLDRDLDIGSVPPQEIKRRAIESVRKNPIIPDSLFLSCTTFRSFEVASEIEDALGIPVFTSNKSASNAIARFLNAK